MTAFRQSRLSDRIYVVNVFASRERREACKRKRRPMTQVTRDVAHIDADTALRRPRAITEPSGAHFTTPRIFAIRLSGSDIIRYRTNFWRLRHRMVPKMSCGSVCKATLPDAGSWRLCPARQNIVVALIVR